MELIFKIIIENKFYWKINDIKYISIKIFIDIYKSML